MKKAFLTIGSQDKIIGTLELELYDRDVPKTVKNFCHHLKNNYRGSRFHRIIRNFMAQGGDYVNGNGTGGESFYGTTFDDENFNHSHSQRGVLSMANSGPNTNGSQFFITFRAAPHLDQKHVVFGQVVAGDAVLQAMEKIPTDSQDTPKLPMFIIDCGVREGNKEKAKSKHAVVSKDKNDVCLDDEDIGKSMGESKLLEGQIHEQSCANKKDTNAPDSLKDRLIRLKMKMNQARQLNRKEVIAEGERFNTNRMKTKENLRIEDKIRREKEWTRQNTKALQMASRHGLDGKSLVQTAQTAQEKIRKQDETKIRNQYSVHDYHNPEGQHRHYERNLKSVPNKLNREETEIYTPVSTLRGDKEREAEGARRLAADMHRRIEKQKKNKRDRIEFEAEDVSFINKRNKVFNQKIGRNYNKATAQIQENLERGTAL